MGLPCLWWREFGLQSTLCAHRSEVLPWGAMELGVSGEGPGWQENRGPGGETPASLTWWPPADVIHTVGPIVHGQPSASQAAELRSCYLSSLNLLLEHGLRSVVRACGVGWGGAPVCVGGRGQVETAPLKQVGGGGAVTQSSSPLPSTPARRSPASPLACLVSGVTERRKGGWAVASPCKRRGGAGGAEGREWVLCGLEPGLTLVGPTGYPNEAAAEAVLATLREWLEQHKDKVRSGPHGDGQKGQGGRRSRVPLTSPVSHCPGQGCRAPSRGVSGHYSPSCMPSLSLCTLWFSNTHSEL